MNNELKRIADNLEDIKGLLILMILDEDVAEKDYLGVLEQPEGYWKSRFKLVHKLLDEFNTK